MSPKTQLAMSADIFNGPDKDGCYQNRQDSLSQQTIIQPKMSIIPRVENPHPGPSSLVWQRLNLNLSGYGYY